MKYRKNLWLSLTSKIALDHCQSLHLSYQSISSNLDRSAQKLGLALYHYGEHHVIEPMKTNVIHKTINMLQRSSIYYVVMFQLF